jgi:hypothetical protein
VVVLAAPGLAMASSGNGSFAVQVLSHGEWTTVGSASFGMQYGAVTVPLPAACSTLRLVQTGGTAAQLDAALLSSQGPAAVDGSADPLVVAKLGAVDNDVTNVFEQAIVLTFPGSASEVTLTGRVQGSLAGAWPFEYPSANTFKPVTADSAFYTYVPGSGGGEPFVRELAQPGTGHPAGETIVRVNDDADALLVTLDFTSDNTMDGADDYAIVHVKTAAGLKDFRVSTSEATWGSVAFTYTDAVSYQHKLYTFAIPWTEIGGRAEVGLAFTAYGTSATFPPATWAPVFRFYNTKTGTHFYTISAEESAAVQQKWPSIFTYEGVAYYTVTGGGDPELMAALTPLYRFYNKTSGSHFYTMSAEEKAYVESHYGAVFTYEGTAYSVFAAPYWRVPTAPVYRFYNKLNGSHFYTISQEEKSLVMFMWSATYKYEGIGFYAAPYYYGSI